MSAKVVRRGRTFAVWDDPYGQGGVWVAHTPRKTVVTEGFLQTSRLSLGEYARLMRPYRPPNKSRRSA